MRTQHLFGALRCALAHQAPARARARLASRHAVHAPIDSLRRVLLPVAHGRARVVARLARCRDERDVELKVGVRLRHHREPELRNAIGGGGGVAGEGG